jgi:hypothetical protein
MWRLYTQSGEGIAIQSTYSRLQKSLTAAGRPIYMGLVKYADYERDMIPGGNMFNAFVYKRKSFEHEKEVRLLCPPSSPLQDIPEAGIDIRVDLNALVEVVYLAPDSAPWLEALVSNVIRRYGFRFPVERSKLNEKPLY